MPSSGERGRLVDPSSLVRHFARVTGHLKRRITRPMRLLGCLPSHRVSPQVVDAVLHPETRGPIPAPFRFCAFAPANLVICAGLLSAANGSLVRVSDRGPQARAASASPFAACGLLTDSRFGAGRLCILAVGQSVVQRGRQLLQLVVGRRMLARAVSAMVALWTCRVPVLHHGSLSAAAPTPVPARSLLVAYCSACASAVGVAVGLQAAGQRVEAALGSGAKSAAPGERRLALIRSTVRLTVPMVAVALGSAINLLVTRSSELEGIAVHTVDGEWLGTSQVAARHALLECAATVRCPTP